MFNALRYTERLEEVGFTREQAQTSVKVLLEIMQENLASKQDLTELRVATQRDFLELKAWVEREIVDHKTWVEQELARHRAWAEQEFAAVRREITDLRKDMDRGFVHLEQRLTIKMGTMLIAAVSVGVGIMKFL